MNHASDIDGKHDITTDIKKRSKHPKVAKPKQSAIIDKPETKTEGHLWKHNSRWHYIHYQKLIGVWRTNTDWHGYLERNDLFEIIWCPLKNAGWWNCHPAKRLMTNTIPQYYISTLLACRLVLLNKKDKGISSVGAGECLRRIIGKTITGLLKENTTHAVGTLPTCAGLESGIEAAIHAVRKSFKEDSSECLLVVDTDNAFNKLNRKVSLENIKRLCPPIYTYLHNSYSTPAMLYLDNVNHILSQEGVWRKGTM